MVAVGTTNAFWPWGGVADAPRLDAGGGAIAEAGTRETAEVRVGGIADIRAAVGLGGGAAAAEDSGQLGVVEEGVGEEVEAASAAEDVELDITSKIPSLTSRGP